MRMDSILWKTSFKGAGDNVDGGDGYRRWQQVVVEIGEVRRGELVERCDEFVDEVIKLTVKHTMKCLSWLFTSSIKVNNSFRSAVQVTFAAIFERKQKRNPNYKTSRLEFASFK
ncbi:hypothetical protein CDAR_588541 [Caerostris darwini]|uniref:Uncharacterized protein n=1 Tax=Caerostris darwini TaxID=1538125 RepID=A0AAV4MHT2_9ARAC|nr:hypothetical protein CDAR_588541 [Caerostris darwini]